MALSPNAFVPLDALRLTEDIRDLDEARKHLNKVDVRNITEDNETGRKIMQLLTSEIQLCRQYAEKKLRTQFLTPPKRFERRGKSSV
jgi:hypothetical protein